MIFFVRHVRSFGFGLVPAIRCKSSPAFLYLDKGDTFVNNINWYHKRINSRTRKHNLRKKGVTFKKKLRKKAVCGLSTAIGRISHGMVLRRWFHPPCASLASSAKHKTLEKNQRRGKITEAQAGGEGKA